MIDSMHGVGSAITRREALRLGGATVGTVLGGSLLAACGSSSSQTTTQSAAKGIKKGGILHVGVAGGGIADTLDPTKAESAAYFSRVYSLYEPLTRRDA